MTEKKKKKGKNKGGRPTVMTPDTLAKLERAFSLGANRGEACAFADISVDALHDYIRKKPEFNQRIDLLRGLVNFKAKANIVGAVNRGDLEQSRYWLEKRSDEFSPKAPAGGEMAGATFTLTVNPVAVPKRNEQD